MRLINSFIRPFNPVAAGASTGAYLHTWLDAADVATITKDESNLVSSWANKGLGSVAAATAAGSLRPTYTAANANGDPVMTLGGTQYFTLGSIGDYDFMHSGTGVHVFIVSKITSVGIYGLLASRSSGTQVGYSLVTLANRVISHTCGNGSANVFSDSTQTNAYPTDKTTIVSSYYQEGASPERASKVGGVQFTSGTNATAPSIANATTSAKLGANGNGTVPISGELAEVLIYRGAKLSAEEEIRVLQYLRQKWNSLDAVANLVVEAGQSNQVSSDTIANSSYSLNDVIPNAYIYDRNDFTGTLDTFYPLTVGVNNVTGTTNGTLFSVNVKLAEDLAVSKGNCFIIKYAEGSTDLATDWNSNPAGPQWTALQTRINEAIPQLLTAGYGINFLGMMWWQGGSDSQVEAKADAYEANQNKLNAAIRANANIPDDLLIVMMGLKTSDSGTYIYVDEINTAKQNVAASDDRAIYIPNTYTLIDGIHVGSPDLEVIGALVATYL